jgi:hypothetical protein
MLAPKDARILHPGLGTGRTIHVNSLDGCN